jgi:hypothetical protein
LETASPATISGSAASPAPWSSGASSAATTASSRASAASCAALAETPGAGRIGVTTAISSRAASNTTITVGRMSSMSGTPIGSGLAGGSFSIRRTMS